MLSLRVIKRNKSNDSILPLILLLLVILSTTTFKFGYQIAAFVFFFIAFLYIFLTKNLLFNEKFLIINLFLLFFDNADFQFYGDYRLRIWYFTSYILLLFNLRKLNTVFIRKFTEFQINFIILYLFLFIYHISFFFIETDNNAKLYNFKYLFFYINIIFICSSISIKNTIHFFRYIIQFSNTICLFGIVQFAANLLGLKDFQFFSENIRPAAFFSETNWYALLCVITFFLNVNFKKTYFNNLTYYILQILIAIGLCITVSRSGIIVFFILLIFYYAKNYKKIISIQNILILVISLIFFSYLIRNLESNYNFTIDILNRIEKSSEDGRAEAFSKSLELIKEGNLFFGNGFYNSESNSVDNGSAFGSKSYNFILMILHVYGVLFFFLFIYIIFRNIYLLNKKKFFSFLYFIIFLIFSLFHPLHFYSLGIFILSISILISTSYDVDTKHFKFL